MFLFLFKRLADSVFIFGENDECEYPAGNLGVIPNREAGTVTIHYLDGKMKHENVHFSSFKNEQGVSYQSFDELKAAYAGFFFRNVGASLVGGYLTMSDNTTSMKFRIGIRNSQYVIDKELTATGFSGVENVDWQNIGGAY
jgi:hypothetical protein